MSIIDSLILGVVQGLTEFIPVSSTAHLTLAGKYLGLIKNSNPEEWTALLAVIQLGTLVAVLIYFWNDIFKILKNFFNTPFTLNNNNTKLGWLIIVGTIPVVIIGLLLKDFIEGSFTKDLNVIAISLILLAIILFFAEKTGTKNKSIEKITWLDSLIIGLAQCVALIPGSSRSGTTITAALFCGLKRDDAARFSFLLSIPAIFASGVLELFALKNYIYSLGASSIMISIVSSAIVGYFSIEFLLKYLKTHSTYIFIIYRIIVGLIIFKIIL
ncbi:MAG: undecaprenyl-diphosphatase UppP [Bacteroidetes bacterium]|nr:undecaprenyl-diphosphatase UppP [Bacteroidota bacterium]